MVSKVDNNISDGLEIISSEYYKGSMSTSTYIGLSDFWINVNKLVPNYNDIDGLPSIFELIRIWDERVE